MHQEHKQTRRKDCSRRRSSDGTGFVTVERFIAKGIEHVFIIRRPQEALDAAIGRLGGKSVTAVQGDTANLTDLDHLYSVIRKQKNHLDILFANASAFKSEPLASITRKNFDKFLNVNVREVLFIVLKVLPIFKDAGSIVLNVFNDSIKRFLASSVYCATKAAVSTVPVM